MDPRSTEVQTLTSASLGILAFAFLAPVIWGGLNTVMYLGLAGLLVAGTQSATTPPDWGAVAVYGVLLTARAVTTAIAVGGLGVVGHGFYRSLSGDFEPAPRAAAVGLGAAVLNVVGSLLTFDCLGVFAAMLPTLASGFAAWAVMHAARVAREETDASRP